MHYYVTPSDGIIDRWVPQENSNQDIKLNPSNSTLFVPANGLYNVYAQVLFDEKISNRHLTMLTLIYFDLALLCKCE